MTFRVRLILPLSNFPRPHQASLLYVSSPPLHWQSCIFQSDPRNLRPALDWPLHSRSRVTKSLLGDNENQATFHYSFILSDAALCRPELSRLRALGCCWDCSPPSPPFLLSLGRFPTTESGYSPWLILIAAIPTGGNIVACKCWSLTGVVCSLRTGGPEKVEQRVVAGLVAVVALYVYISIGYRCFRAFSGYYEKGLITLVCVGVLTTVDTIYPPEVSCVNTRHYL